MPQRLRTIVLGCAFCVLVMAWAGADAEGRIQEFGKNRKQNVSLFMAPDGWKPHLREARRTYWVDGLAQAYNKLGQDFKKIEGRAIQTLSVGQMKKTFSQAFFLALAYTRDVMGKNEGKSKADRRKAEALVRSHEQYRKRLVSPEHVLDVIQAKVGMSEDQAVQLVNAITSLLLQIVEE